MDDLPRFCCLHSECPEHGKRGAGNLSVTSRYGPDKSRRMLRCSVGRLSKLAGEHARDLHEELVAFSPEGPRGPVR